MDAHEESEGLTDLRNHATGCENVWQVSQEIRAWSRSFKETGNFHAHGVLQGYADSLDEAVEMIRVSQRRDFYRSHMAIMESPWNLLKATLAGIEIGQKSTETKTQ